MPAANSSSIEGVATQPLTNSRARANGTKAPAASRARATPAVTEAPAAEASASAADPAPSKVGRGRPAGSKDTRPRAPRTIKPEREPKAPGGLDTKAITSQVSQQISDAKKARRTAEAEFKAKDRELTRTMNAAIKAHSDAQTAHDKLIASLDAKIKAGEDLLAKIAG